MLAIGLAPPFASAQSERVVAVEDREAYVEEFNYDPDDPPVIDGVKGLTEAEVAEYKEKIRQAEASGPPQDEIAPGHMWSDKVGIPEGVDKAEADHSEVAIAKERAQPQSHSLRAAATQCKTFWLTPHRVCGSILNRYEALGGMTSWLLLPIEGQRTNPDGQGTRQRFAGGFIYSHPTTGTHAVANHTANVWQRHGWEAGWLGYPTSGEVPVEGSTGIDGEINGWVQKFEGGQIYRTPAAQGFQVASINGLILEKWQDMGGPSSDLGFPIADEAKTPDGQGRFSTFQHGSLYWHPNHGAHPVTGAVLFKWERRGSESGAYGYPVGDPTTNDEGLEKQVFEHGTIIANPRDILTSFSCVAAAARAALENGIDEEYSYICSPLGVYVEGPSGQQHFSSPLPEDAESRQSLKTSAQPSFPLAAGKPTGTECDWTEPTHITEPRRDGAYQVSKSVDMCIGEFSINNNVDWSREVSWRIENVLDQRQFHRVNLYITSLGQPQATFTVRGRLREDINNWPDRSVGDFIVTAGNDGTKFGTSTYSTPPEAGIYFLETTRMELTIPEWGYNAAFGGLQFALGRYNCPQYTYYSNLCEFPEIVDDHT
ncbi:LGFP repeat-containing protein [Corynebacterium casei]|uniref:LGFP repeat-containing protein n=1 Tax=Corynebacterium casei TaxID=160386 RepID=UPI003F93865D